MSINSVLSTSSSFNTLTKEAKPESENQWSAVLNEVRASTSNRLTEKNLLILGDRETGKSNLVGKLIGVEQIIPSGVGLEHLCIPVKDEDREDSTQVNAWILEEEEYAASLLPLVFNEKTFDKSVVWLVVSMAKPWSMIQSLDKWITILSQTIDRMKIDPVVMKQHYSKLEKLFKDYVDPSVAKSPGSGAERDVDLPLGETTLTCNLGVPIVVVVTKADYITVLEKDLDYKDEKFDFLQIHLRNWCLKYGAAIIFTSAKENKNLKNTHRYTAHLLYGLKFEEEGYVLDRDSVFIPIGWDNEKKIGVLDDNLGDIRPTDAFDSVIAAPPPLVKQNNSELVYQAEEDQEFVKKIQGQLAQPVPTRLEPVGTPKQMERRQASPSAQGSPKKADGPRNSLGSGGANESALSSFFNTLLNKNTKGSPTPTGRISSPASVRVDAAAELSRLSRGRQSPTSTNSESSDTPEVQ